MSAGSCEARATKERSNGGGVRGHFENSTHLEFAAGGLTAVGGGGGNKAMHTAVCGSNKASKSRGAIPYLMVKERSDDADVPGELARKISAAAPTADQLPAT